MECESSFFVAIFKNKIKHQFFNGPLHFFINVCFQAIYTLLRSCTENFRRITPVSVRLLAGFKGLLSKFSDLQATLVEILSKFVVLQARFE